MVSEGRLQPVSQPPREATWNFPEPFGRQEVVEVPLSETILIARHLRVSELRSYMNKAPLNDLGDPTTPPPTSCDERGRSDQRFVLEVAVRRDGNERRALASGRDIYAVTAPLVCEAAQRIVEGSVQPRGAFAPGEIFDAENFLQALSPEHLTFSLQAPSETRARIEPAD